MNDRYTCANKDRANVRPSCSSLMDGRRFWMSVTRSAGTWPRSLSVLVAIERKQTYARNQHHDHGCEADDDSPICPGHKSLARVIRRESFMRLPVLIPAVESDQISARNPVSLWQADALTPSMPEHGSIRGKDPSGEECTSDTSGPLELCSTEDHNHHLQRMRR